MFEATAPLPGAPDLVDIVMLDNGSVMARRGKCCGGGDGVRTRVGTGDRCTGPGRFRRPSRRIECLYNPHFIFGFDSFHAFIPTSSNLCLRLMAVHGPHICQMPFSMSWLHGALVWRTKQHHQARIQGGRRTRWCNGTAKKFRLPFAYRTDSKPSMGEATDPQKNTIPIAIYGQAAEE